MPADRHSHRPTRAEALAHLPPAYSLALRLRDAGVADGLIAECLAVEPEAIRPLFDVAEAKLAALLEAPPRGPGGSGGNPGDRGR